MIRRHPMLARFAAPTAFLVAVTVGVLLVRSSLSAGTDTGSPAVTSVGTGATTGPRTPTPPRRSPGRGSRAARFYEIRAGDTLETVAAEFETTVEQLLVLNPDVDPVALGIGERIRVK